MVSTRSQTRLHMCPSSVDRLSKVPLDLLIIIASFLEVKDIFHLQQCCTTLHLATQTRQLWVSVARKYEQQFPLNLPPGKNISELTTAELICAVVSTARLIANYRSRRPRMKEMNTFFTPRSICERLLVIPGSSLLVMFRHGTVSFRDWTTFEHIKSFESEGLAEWIIADIIGPNKHLLIYDSVWDRCPCFVVLSIDLDSSTKGPQRYSIYQKHKLKSSLTSRGAIIGQFTHDRVFGFLAKHAGRVVLEVFDLLTGNGLILATDIPLEEHTLNLDIFATKSEVVIIQDHFSSAKRWVYKVDDLTDYICECQAQSSLPSDIQTVDLAPATTFLLTAPSLPPSCVVENKISSSIPGTSDSPIADFHAIAVEYPRVAERHSNSGLETVVLGLTMFSAQRPGWSPSTWITQYPLTTPGWAVLEEGGLKTPINRKLYKLPTGHTIAERNEALLFTIGKTGRCLVWLVETRSGKEHLELVYLPPNETWDTGVQFEPSRLQLPTTTRVEDIIGVDFDDRSGMLVLGLRLGVCILSFDVGLD